MKAPLLQLSSDAKVEVTVLAIVITVRTGAADHDAVERIYQTFGRCGILHDGVFVGLKLVDTKAQGDNVLYLGIPR